MEPLLVQETQVVLAVAVVLPMVVAQAIRQALPHLRVIMLLVLLLLQVQMPLEMVALVLLHPYLGHL
jgi:tryptophan-rich sensory protein